MPHIAVKYMHKLLNLNPVYEMIEQKDIINRYGIKNLYLYLLVKFSSVDRAEKSKWYQ
jgi:hypothetical protein